MRLFIIIILTVVFLDSCSDKRDFELTLKTLGIELSDSYEIDSVTQTGFSDWTLEANVKISENDKKEILSQISTKSNFPIVQYRKEYFEKYHQKGESIHGYKIGAKYYYGISIPRYAEFKDGLDYVGYETYDIELDTINNKMFFKYEYE